MGDQESRITISIHALLAEGDGPERTPFDIEQISIHALLAEGDGSAAAQRPQQRDFYPRPPCGGRQKAVDQVTDDEVFLSTPSLRRATDTCNFLFLPN